MTVFRAQVFYALPGAEKWSNVYHADAANLTDALSEFVSTAAPILAEALHNSCLITRILVSSLVDDTFVEETINMAGTSAFTDARLPLFNSVKMLFSTDGLGRPDYKFFKGWLTEGNCASGSIDGTPAGDFTTNIQGLITAMAAASVPLVSESGDPWLTAAIQTLIQMRQMHRRRKRVTP